MNAQNVDEGRRILAALLAFIDDHGAWNGNEPLLSACLGGFRQVRLLASCLHLAHKPSAPDDEV